MNEDKKRVEALLTQISIGMLGTKFLFILGEDHLYKVDGVGRVFLQISYFAKCNKTDELQNWKGRKWYLSEFMTDDEIVKTAYTAYEMAIRHEMMETFKFNGIPLFNPHTSYKDILTVSRKEVTR